MCDAIIISYDNSSNDVRILIVGRKAKGEAIDIINAFQGIEATALYSRLVTRKEENKWLMIRV